MTLSVAGVHAGYPGTEVLRGVDLTVPSGAVVVLLGPNGAGKTTTLRTIAGLLRPTRGQVLLDGEDLTSRPPHHLVDRGVCLVPEGRAVFPSLSVRENLRLFQGGSSPREAVDLAVDAFPPLGARLDQAVGTMSGGEQQMVALSRAFLTQPRYVLLDEVSLGLAPKVIDVIFESLERLAAAGLAMLIVEQYVHRALELADTVYVLNKGSVTFSGAAGEIDADLLADEYLGAAELPDHRSENR